MFSCQKMKSIFFVFLVVLCTTNVVFTHHPWYPDLPRNYYGNLRYHEDRKMDGVHDRLQSRSYLPVDHDAFSVHALFSIPRLAVPEKEYIARIPLHKVKTPALVLPQALHPLPYSLVDHDSILRRIIHPAPLLRSPGIVSTRISPSSNILVDHDVPPPLPNHDTLPSPYNRIGRLPGQLPRTRVTVTSLDDALLRYGIPLLRKIGRVPLTKVTGAKSLFGRSPYARRTQPDFAVNDAVVAPSDLPVDNGFRSHVLRYPRINRHIHEKHNHDKHNHARSSPDIVANDALHNHVSDPLHNHDTLVRRSIPTSSRLVGFRPVRRNQGKRLDAHLHDALLELSDDSAVNQDTLIRDNVSKILPNILQIPLKRGKTSGPILSDAPVDHDHQNHNDHGPHDHDTNSRHTVPSYPRSRDDSVAALSDNHGHHDHDANSRHSFPSVFISGDDAPAALSGHHDHDANLRHLIPFNPRSTIPSRQDFDAVSSDAVLPGSHSLFDNDAVPRFRLPSRVGRR
uniref:Uncharacterized protein LOC114333129 n=1 Tax=Diabrotica virgifera virgifera TaxID=50390 RepID=A0A6P7FQY9_DIAVI